MGLRGNSAGDCLSVMGLGEMGRDDGGSVGGESVVSLGS